VNRESEQTVSLSEKNILVVEDDAGIADLLRLHLREEVRELGFESNGKQGLAAARTGHWDLLLLDLRLPGISGLDLCRSLRAEGLTIPVIMMTAKSGELDRVLGLEIGADDYITKPFNPRELIARIRSVLRRAKETSNKKRAKANRIANFGEWRLDTSLGELQKKDNTVISLSTGELRLLNFFLANPNTILSRDEIITHTQGREAFPFERSIDNMISRLRGKIEPNKKKPVHIQTVWGGGYKFNPNMHSE